MKKIILALGFPLLAAPALAGDMKAGLWEMKTIKQIMDGRDMKAQMAAAQAQMQQQMASMPPDQRRQMEAMMSRQGMSMGGDGTARICISPEAAKRDEPMVDPEGRCKPTKMSRSGNTTRFEFDCNTEGRRSVGKGESTVSGNTISSRMDMTTTDALKTNPNHWLLLQSPATTHRRVARRFAGLDYAPRKADLSGMREHGCRADGERHVPLPVARIQKHQDRCFSCVVGCRWRRFAVGRGKVGQHLGKSLERFRPGQAFRLL